jgi:uncharacterized protein (TIGR02594 family)
MTPETLKIAFGELGQKEIPGAGNNERILEYQELTGLEFGRDSVAWCSIFANWVALQANLPQSNKANARSWLDVGRKTSSPKPGDVVVFWRFSKTDWRGHVGFFIGYKEGGDKIYCIGGNQSDMVNIQEFGLDRVLEFRRLTSNAVIEFPVGLLRKGDSNSQVKLLQQILIELGFILGNVHGVFGPMTENALMDFQRSKRLTVDGI